MRRHDEANQQRSMAAIASTSFQEENMRHLTRLDAPPQPSGQLDDPTMAVPPACVFISYARGVEPDAGLALELAAALGQQHAVFVDSGVPHAGWAERIDAELRQADVVIVLLSAQAIQSELVAAELATATQLAGTPAGHPAILPVRLAYPAPFPYPVSTYLDSRAWTTWDAPDDTARLVDDLQRAIAGGPLTTPDAVVPAIMPSSFPPPAPTAPLELPEGTMDPQSAFYIVRPSDTLALQTIERQGVTITIKGPRQMGKSSLLVRTAEAAIQAGKRVALLDFQFIDSAALASAEVFLRQFCAWLSYRLNVADQVAEYWRLPLGNIQRCTAYVEDYLLPAVHQPLVLALDEVDTIFDTDFRSDFFGMLRGWHNRRQATSVWKQFDLVLVTSTEPYQLVANLNQSPFNVGQVIELEDFTPAQLADLNARHGSPFTLEQEAQLMTLLGGQPYLVRQALYLVASGRLTAEVLFATTADERGPFGDHLRYHLLRMHDNAELVAGLQQVLKHHTCTDERVFFRLRGAGLVKRQVRAVVPRCQLYADYFREHLAAATASRRLDPLPSDPAGLSGREVEVLRLLAAGLSNAQIAKRLVISAGTVNTHLSTIYSKLGVSSRTAAVRWAMDHGLI
jgi:DNA-binding CsgD family transcriptional regulator